MIPFINTDIINILMYVASYIYFNSYHDMFMWLLFDTFSVKR